MRVWSLILAAFALLAGAAPAAAGDDSLARVRAAGALRWAGDLQGGEPYVYEDPNQGGRLVGFEVALAEALARELGVRSEFVQNDWSTLVPSLERGTFDVLLNGFEATPERRARLRLSRPYFRFAERLVVRAGDASAPRDLGSLRGRRIGTLASSYAWQLLGEAGADRVPYEGVQEPYLDLRAKRIDAVLMDDIIADRYGRLEGLVVAGDVASGTYVAAFRREDVALADAVDRAIQKLWSSGEWRRLLARHGLDGTRQAALAAEQTGAVPPQTAAAPALRRPMSRQELWLFVRGAGVTLAVSVLAMALAIAGGLGLAVARRRTERPGRRITRAIATAYVEVFRGTPVLLQLYVLYFGLADLLAMGPFTAAVVGLGLNYAAYEAEVYRAGIEAVPRGQVEAGRALGMSEALVFRRIVLPQALRVSLPAVTNDFIALLKDSSLVSVITVVELTKRMTITAVEVGSWLRPGLLCAALYFVMSYPLARLARRAEARLSRGG